MGRSSSSSSEPSLSISVALLFLLFYSVTLFNKSFSSLDRTANALATNDPHSSSFPNSHPQKIWQSWKVPASDLARADARAVTSWTELNPEYRYELLTDAAALRFVQDRFSADHPRIAETYANISDPILRADLLRYLLLYSEGGVYTDVDTRALKPIDAWVPPQYKRDAKLVVGVEMDYLDGTAGTNPFDGVKFGLCQWTVLAYPQHPLLWTVVNAVVDALHAKAASKATTIADMALTFVEVGAVTGPGMWSDTILGHLNAHHGTTVWDLHNLTAPALVGDVLILPVTGFANGQKHSNSGSPSDPDALVRHLFKGSWIEGHPYPWEVGGKPSVDVNKQPSVEAGGRHSVEVGKKPSPEVMGVDFP